jgi:hypothetical protein
LHRPHGVLPSVVMKNTTNTITRTALINRLTAPGAVIASFGTLTDSRARKTGNPFGVIMKTARFTGMVGADYQKMVERQEVKAGAEEPTFKAEPLPWGQWVEGQEGKVIAHKGGLYLRVSFPPNLRQPKARVTYRTQEGRFIPAREALQFIPAPKPSARQEAVGVTGEAEVKVRTFALDSIRYVKIDGTLYRVKGD